jgi:alpha-methylacyl-CoA racemase
MLAQGAWGEARADNWLDGAAPFYRCYTCACGGFIAVGALEPQFYALLLEKLGLSETYRATQNDKETWLARRAEFAEIFARQSRDTWAMHFDGTDACVAPVLTFAEAADHPHMAARKNLQALDGVTQSGSAPRFSRTSGRDISAPRARGADTQRVLTDLGLGEDPQA